MCPLSLAQLPGRDVLLPVGVTLFVLGIVLRGLAREHRRTLALRKEHELDARKRGEPAVPPSESHLEKHFGTYASIMTILGALIAIASFFR